MSLDVDKQEEHVKFFSKFVIRCLKKEQQPQIITVDQSRQVEKDDWYVETFLNRLLEYDVICRAGWLGHIEAFTLTIDAVKGQLQLEELKAMLLSAVKARKEEDAASSNAAS